jgi:hypothetical protein
LSDQFPVQNCAKKVDLTPLLLNFALEYAIKKLQENKVELNGVHQLLDYSYDVTMLGDHIDTMKEGIGDLK